MMEKIVNNPIISDFHIHSVASKFKDGDVVLNSTINNISVLIKKLNENHVGMASITDHDAFDYNIYERLKQEEGKGTIKKIFPGVEFTVKFKSNRKDPLHIITIFNDENVEKVKKISEVLKFNTITNRPRYDKKNSFSEKKFLDILSKIDLDTVMIVHQKQTISSKSKPCKHDANSLGEERLNDLILTEYFEAFEFKNIKNELFNNLEKRKYSNNAMRFITGSDCHEWESYPKHDSKSQESPYCFTYLKCLPSFRGLSFAITDDSRITFHKTLFNQQESNFIKSIDYKINGITLKIPLSKGINAIIGDNSIGKSLLLHNLTNYYRAEYMQKLSPVTKQIRDRYNKYLEKNKLEILTKIPIEHIFAFDTQGEIRKKFNLNLLREEDFFKGIFPDNTDVSFFKDKALKYIDKCIAVIDDKFDHDSAIKNIKDISLNGALILPTSLSFKKIDNNLFTQNIKDITDKVSFYEKLNQIISNDLSSLHLSDRENKKIINFQTFVNEYLDFYQSKLDSLNNYLKILNSINVIFEKSEQDSNRVLTEYNKIYHQYANDKNNFSQSIAKVVRKNYDFTFPLFEDGKLDIKPKTKPYKNYTFVKKTKINRIDSDYLIELINSPLRRNKSLFNCKINDLTINDFISMLSKYDDSEGAPIVFFRNKIIDRLNSDLVVTPKIVYYKDDVEQEYSDGINSKFYFNIISSDDYNNGIYLIDQPEDDVSPKAIREYLISDFKNMSNTRQIILVTHNPQFVVNLDVDNVIYMSKVNNDIKIQSGALEYKDGDTDIIKIVAETLEGGVESIRQRWKRYEKNNTGIFKR